MRRWLVYALGGGFGHLTRAAALARVAGPDISVRILTNSPYAGCVRDALPELDIIALDPAMSLAEARLKVVSQIETSAPDCLADCLIVDTFPRGLGGELVDTVSSFPGVKVFVQRDLNPQYATAFGLKAFVRDSFDLVLVPGDLADHSLGPFPQTATTAPWLVRSPHEVFSRSRAREVLALHDAKPCVIVCAAGNLDELAWYGAVARHLVDLAAECDVRCIAPVRPVACPPSCWLSYWPALDLFAAADVVIGGCGYNLVYECLACRVPLIARPWPRKYDRQRLRGRRAANLGAVTLVEDPSEAVAAAIAAIKSTKAEGRSRFHNGAADAIALINQLHRFPEQGIH